MKIVYRAAGLDIIVEQATNRTFAVTYGQQCAISLTYEQAAKELGQCIFHALACSGELDNG